MKRQKDTQTITKAKDGQLFITDINCFGSRNDGTYYLAVISADRKSIRIHGNNSNCKSGTQLFDLTFKVGDKATYDSYNLIYIGTIVAIGEKTVTIETDTLQSEKRRLSIGDFIWRNFKFDLEKVRAENANWLD